MPAKCIERSRYGKRFTILAAGEGAMPAGDHCFVERIDRSSRDPVRLGGVGKLVAHEVEKHTGLESRTVILGYVQRGGTRAPLDRLLATEFGFPAFELIMKGRFGESVVHRGGRIGTISIREVAGKIRTVPPDHILLRAARAIRQPTSATELRSSCGRKPTRPAARIGCDGRSPTVCSMLSLAGGTAAWSRHDGNGHAIGRTLGLVSR